MWWTAIAATVLLRFDAGNTGKDSTSAGLDVFDVWEISGKVLSWFQVCAALQYAVDNWHGQYLCALVLETLAEPFFWDMLDVQEFSRTNFQVRPRLVHPSSTPQITIARADSCVLDMWQEHCFLGTNDAERNDPLGRTSGG